MKFYIRLCIMLCSNVLLGVSIGLFRLVDLGTDPFSSMIIGLSNATRLSFGNIQCIICFLLFFAMVIWKRDGIGLGTLPSIFLNGYVSDFVYFAGIDSSMNPSTLVGKFILLAFALIICTFSVALYMETNLGTSAYDTLAIIIEQQTHAKVSFKMARIYTDSCCLLTGFLLGASIGINTLIMSVCTGIMVQYFRVMIQTKAPIFNTRNLQGQIINL